MNEANGVNEVNGVRTEAGELFAARVGALPGEGAVKVSDDLQLAGPVLGEALQLAFQTIGTKDEGPSGEAAHAQTQGKTRRHLPLAKSNYSHEPLRLCTLDDD